MPEHFPTIDCGHCGTPVKRSVRTCPACHAQRGVGRIASGRVVGPEKIPKLRRLLALSLAGLVVFWATGVGKAPWFVAPSHWGWSFNPAA